MPCPRCAATDAAAQPRRTALGYRTFHRRACRRRCNERTGTPCNHRRYPTDLVLLVMLWRLRDTLRLRDLAAMLLARGFAFGDEAVRGWAARSGTLTRRTARSTAGGAPGIARSTGRGIWSTRDAARRGIWTRRSGASARRTRSPGSRPSE